MKFSAPSSRKAPRRPINSKPNVRNELHNLAYIRACVHGFEVDRAIIAVRCKKIERREKFINAREISHRREIVAARDDFVNVVFACR